MDQQEINNITDKIVSYMQDSEHNPKSTQLNATDNNSLISGHKACLDFTMTLKNLIKVTDVSIPTLMGHIPTNSK